jgi:hypothetical protein
MKQKPAPIGYTLGVLEGGRRAGGCLHAPLQFVQNPQGLHSTAFNVPCERQEQLLKLYKAEVSNYSAAVNDLKVTRGKTLKEENNLLLLLSENARKASERARRELELHIREHHC